MQKKKKSSPMNSQIKVKRVYDESIFSKSASDCKTKLEAFERDDEHFK